MNALTVQHDQGDLFPTEQRPYYQTTIIMQIKLTLLALFLVATAAAQPCNNLQVALAWNAGANGEVFFTATSTGPGTNFIWYFGDGTTDNGAVANHTYQQSGLYGVCVTGWYFNSGTQDTCWAEDCEQVLAQNGGCDGLIACFSYLAELEPGRFLFSNCSNFPPNSLYSWDFGDGTPQENGQGPDHTYQVSGVYQVCLSVVFGGCQRSMCQTITVLSGESPCLDLHAGFTANAQFNVASFQNVSIGLGEEATWFWTFGDGSSSTDGSPEHAYATPGTYQVCLNVISVYPAPNAELIICQDIYCSTIMIGNPNSCAGFFVAMAWNSSQQGEVAFTATSNRPNTNFVWYFGDGAQGDGATALHTYAQPGTYPVCVTGWFYNEATGDTCWTEDCEPVEVGNADPCAQLNALFISTPNGLAIQFISTTSGPSPQSVFTWTFGDGGVGEGPDPVHDYLVAGAYEVCLHVESIYASPGQPDVICEDETCLLVTVGVGDPCEGLVACFNALPFENGAYLFENCSQLLQIDIPAYYAWDLGDGSTSDNAQPDHVFAPGTYTVCLTVTHGDCIDETCTTITVIGPGDPCANFNAGFSTFLSPNGIQFSNATSGTGFQTSFAWTFGDGGSSNDPQPFHTYQLPGTYNVCLVATSIYEGQNGGLITCVDEFCMLVVANGGGEGCDPNYTASFTYQVQNNTVIFVANFITPTLGVVWTFPDGSQAYEPIHTQLFVPPGPYEVCLSTWYWNELTQDTCWATSCQLVNPFTTGTTDIGTEGVNVFPVPASDVLTVSGLPTSATMRLFAADGRLVLTERSTATTHQVHVAGLASGTYVLRIDASERAMYKRVVVE